jgi:hypothetical protein
MKIATITSLGMITCLLCGFGIGHMEGRKSGPVTPTNQAKGEEYPKLSPWSITTNQYGKWGYIDWNDGVIGPFNTKDDMMQSRQQAILWYADYKSNVYKRVTNYWKGAAQ